MVFYVGADVYIETDDDLGKDLLNYNFKQVRQRNNGDIRCVLDGDNRIAAFIGKSRNEWERDNWIPALMQVLPSVYIKKNPDYLFLHGSCLIVGGRIVFLLGGSGSGKSTATYRLMTGVEAVYVSDEEIIIDIEKGYVIPVSDKPVQLRADVVPENWPVMDDAWKVKKVSYFMPNRRCTEAVPLSDHKIIFCFIKYDTVQKRKVVRINRVDTICRIISGCFNASSLNGRYIEKMLSYEQETFTVFYDGDVNFLFEVLNNV